MRNIPPLNWLRAFEVTARLGSFSLAAKELNVTQSAVSQHVKLLEDRLKCTLLVRNPKKLLLTDVGKKYLPFVSSSFLQLESATSELFAQEKETIKLQCDIAFSTLFLAPRLHEFLAAYPDIDIQLQHSVWWQRRLENNNGMSDRVLEIRFGDGNWSDSSTRLCENKVFPVIGKTYTAPKNHLDDWRKHKLFQLSSVHHNWRQWLLHAGVLNDTTKMPAMTVQSDASTILHSLAVNNTGLSLLSSILVSDSLQNGELIKPFDYEMAINETFYLIKPAKHYSVAEGHFINWLTDRIAP